MNIPQIHVYVCHHKLGSSFADSCFIPIQVGAALAKVPLGFLRDDSGENISDKNSTFCELTAIYWAWKNDSNADWIGFMHYRRFFDFNKNTVAENIHGCVDCGVLDDDMRAMLGLNERSLREFISSRPGLKAVLPKKWNVKNIGFKNLNDHYVLAAHHFEKDLLALRAVLAESYPEDVPYFDRVMQDSEGYFTNMFILRRDLFNAYCEWLFPILFKLEIILDRTNYSAAANRVFGYLAERLFNIFVLKTIAGDRNSFVEVERVFVQEPVNPVLLPPVPLVDNAVCVAIAADERFVPHLAALIASMQDNLSKDRLLDLIVLDGGISLGNQQLLERQFANGGRGRLTFLQCANFFTDVPVHGPFSTETFYRLSLGELLPHHRRIIYLDADTIVLGDLAELYETDLGGKAVAAVPDIIMRHFVANHVPASLESGGRPAGHYLKAELGLGERGNEYFQAGLIVIDLDEYRRLHIGKQAYQDLLSKCYWFLDQDVLNKLLFGRVKFLDLEWNVVNASMEVLTGLEIDLAKKAKEVFVCPKMVHYAGVLTKPWNNPSAPLAHYYWYYLRQTVWYEQVVNNWKFNTTLNQPLSRNMLYKALRAVWRKLPNFAQRKLFWVRNRLL